MSKQKIAAIKWAISKWVSKHSFLFVHYPNWYVGITGNINHRKSNHNSNKIFSVSHWKAWDAGSYTNARSIEKFFGGNGKGMSGGIVKGGANWRSRYVYVYK